MLGKTAGGLFWMFRFLERSENTARMLDAGFRIALTRSTAAENEWASVVAAAGVTDAYTAKYDQYIARNVIDFLLRDTSNSSSVWSVIEGARNNARLVRTALTREVWEATNECWITLKDLLAHPISERDLPEVLGTIRQQSALVRGALHGTMLRNDIFDFARLGTYLERADNTARILDVKYYVLLPSASFVGSSLDNVQWESILRSVSAQRAFRWLNPGEINPMGIADFIILDRRLPRSLSFCYAKIVDNLSYLEADYGLRLDCHEMAAPILQRLKESSIASIFDEGLHEFITAFIRDNMALGAQIEQDYRFIG
ncbi:alpha-E domain-containing protein [Sneathiella sp. CAU 1612]|uniref:Alpha-E domain-containing protein n=1 Tax=Sneathiella sedimenti TaxID=2816034 RepID=A0ABS3F7W5_9PROT|nr:alpha-E domain-containing protein [Sneathiella sedimenti]MBO0334611.1 alpha-E domain-containing protein [Sneathiella sedimenti]